MKKVLDIVAEVVSGVFYPLWIPTYGMILFCCSSTQVVSLNMVSWLVLVGGTLLFTGLIPVLLILYQVYRGDIDNIYIHKREQRTLAYIETAGGMVCWWYLLQYIVHAPSWLCGVALGCVVSVVVVAVVNYWWKISAHLTGIGGLLGGVISYYYTSLLVVDYSWFYIVLVVALVVMYARLWLDAHTSWQVIAGLALGIICTLVGGWLYV